MIPRSHNQAPFLDIVMRFEPTAEDRAEAPAFSTYIDEVRARFLESCPEHVAKLGYRLMGPPEVYESATEGA